VPLGRACDGAKRNDHTLLQLAGGLIAFKKAHAAGLAAALRG
jgi:hypothetical protein